MRITQSLRRLAILGVFVAAPCQAQVTEGATVLLSRLGGNVWLAKGSDLSTGGNVAASIGPDGILLVDNMFDEMNARLRKALDSVSTLPIRIVMNTHYHNDHVQGNLTLGKTATIIAQENVLKRVSQGKYAGKYPMAVFTHEFTAHFNGEDIRIVHFGPGHTDGDAVVFFPNAKVIHMGDLFFNGMFPGIYPEAGGDVRHLIVVLERVLGNFPPETKVIPGHGDVATMDELRDYVTMLKETVAAAERGIKANQSVDVLAQQPAFTKYARLGEGGAQTLPQFVAMLVKQLQ
ncbi:MAG: MBL fold metallo-hydrolase [bacterium]